MVTKQHYGLKGLYKSMRQGLPEQELIEDSVDAEIIHERYLKIKKQRDSAGAIGKAKSFACKKAIVTKIHSRLKQLDRNPPLKVLLGELEKGHPEIDWKAGSVKEWWTKLNKGEEI